ncbi:MAG: methylenetetrahydrofolate reductase [Spirochaetaceae bacterium]|nr:methylenetetrahydrofolate reductase [Spirochaetaceae bacterium]
MIKHVPGKTFFSFEVFPPKKDGGIEKVYETLDELSDLKPDFISVTYGAGGSENCGKTLDIAKRIKDVCHVESVIHLPGLHLTKKDAETMLKTFADNGIENRQKPPLPTAEGAAVLHNPGRCGSGFSVLKQSAHTAGIMFPAFCILPRNFAK